MGPVALKALNPGMLIISSNLLIVNYFSEVVWSYQCELSKNAGQLLWLIASLLDK